jgi:hypothetical protein
MGAMNNYASKVVDKADRPDRWELPTWCPTGAHIARFHAADQDAAGAEPREN